MRIETESVQEPEVIETEVEKIRREFLTVAVMFGVPLTEAWARFVEAYPSER